MSEETQDVSWIVPGALCNCLGDGTDKLLIHTVDNDSATVYVLKDGIDLSIEQAREQWQEGFYCWESFHKLHRDYLIRAEKNFNIIEKFGLEALKKVIKKKVKLIQVPCPENAVVMLRKYFDVKDDDSYYDDYGGAIVLYAAYLAEKILGANDTLAMAIGRIVYHLYDKMLDEALGGSANEYDYVAKFIESLGIHKKVAKHYSLTVLDWGEEIYYQDLEEVAGHKIEREKKCTAQ